MCRYRLELELELELELGLKVVLVVLLQLLLLLVPVLLTQLLRPAHGGVLLHFLSMELHCCSSCCYCWAVHLRARLL